MVSTDILKVYGMPVLADVVGIARLLVCQSVEVLLDYKVDSTWWRIRQEVLELCRIHCVEMSLDS